MGLISVVSCVKQGERGVFSYWKHSCWESGSSRERMIILRTKKRVKQKEYIGKETAWKPYQR